MTWFHVVPSVSLPDRTFIISRYPTTVLLLLLFFFFFIKTLHKFYIRKPKFDQTNSHQMSSCDGAKESLTWLKQRLTHRFICNASGCLRWHFDNGLWSDTSMCGFSCYKYPGGRGLLMATAFFFFLPLFWEIQQFSWHFQKVRRSFILTVGVARTSKVSHQRIDCTRILVFLFRL